MQFFPGFIFFRKEELTLEFDLILILNFLLNFPQPPPKNLAKTMPKSKSTEADSNSLYSIKSIENPFKELHQESRKYAKLITTLQSELRQALEIAFSSAQEAERFRKEANHYKEKNNELVKINDKIKAKFDYTDARYQMAKKWIKSEYDLREEMELQLQNTERERDNLKQIVQLCKELMLEDEELGSLDGATAEGGKSVQRNFSRRFSQAFGHAAGLTPSSGVNPKNEKMRGNPNYLPAHCREEMTNSSHLGIHGNKYNLSKMPSNSAAESVKSDKFECLLEKLDKFKGYS